MRRLLATGAATGAALVMSTTPVFACGGLVAPDGDVHLDRATTFVAWHGGVEHYITSFAYSGTAPDVGWIVPLPAVPSQVEAAGRWTLQRLELQFNPPRRFGALNEGAASAAAPVVVQQVQVEALDITVLKGTGQAVLDWCAHNGFVIPQDTHDHLLKYAQASPVFMAAKYDAAAAQQRGLRSGDGVPLLITMQTPQLWVPLEVLANDDDAVNPDLFLLTDSPLQPAHATSLWSWPLPLAPSRTDASVDGAPGFTLASAQAMSDQLYRDVSGDRNMSWVPQHGWLTYLTLHAPSDQVTYDLGVGSDDVIRLASFGTPPGSIAPAVPPGAPAALVAACLTAAVALLSGAFLLSRRGWRSGRARSRAAARDR
ncbi:MAG: DUF2330 domain-containing protein [Candidatus Dormibacteria bacterium]